MPGGWSCDAVGVAHGHRRRGDDTGDVGLASTYVCADGLHVRQIRAVSFHPEHAYGRVGKSGRVLRADIDRLAALDGQTSSEGGRHTVDVCGVEYQVIHIHCRRSQPEACQAEAREVCRLGAHQGDVGPVQDDGALHGHSCEKRAAHRHDVLVLQHRWRRHSPLGRPARSQVRSVARVGRCHSDSSVLLHGRSGVGCRVALYRGEASESRGR